MQKVTSVLLIQDQTRRANKSPMHRREALMAIASGWIGLAGACLAGRIAIAASRDSRIDINHAGMEELLTLPGVTRVWAARILRFRPYRMKSDLVDRGVVTDQVYGKIKDLIVAHRSPQ